MNYLGHIYFSADDHELAIYNLFGDFHRGKIGDDLPKKIQDGIALHRRIDHFIDHHPRVQLLKNELYEDLPKVAPIAVDVVFDHLLATQWREFHSTDLNQFLSIFFDTTVAFEPHLPLPFHEFLFQMRKHQWLYHYPDELSIEKMANSISKRLSFENKLIDLPTVYRKKKSAFKSAFSEFMVDAKSEFNY